MSSPFEAFANATLVFTINGTQMSYDPLTGNAVPVLATLSVVAYLKPDSRPKALFYPGVDESEEPMVGYTVVPRHLPASVPTNAKAQANIGGVEGIFTLSLATPSAFTPLVESITGTKLAGTFRRQV